MSSPGSEPSADSEARDHRRWLVGIGISLVFGLFSMIMALLSYSERDKPTSPAAAKPSPSPGGAREPGPRSRFPSDRRR
jgi:hypothetical protein